MTKKKTEPKETHKFWTIELNIGSKRNMGKWNKSTTRRGHGYYSTHDLNTVREKVKNRFDGGGGNVIKAMFEFDGTYNDEIEKSYYISFTFYGGIDYIVIDNETKEPLPEKQYMSLDSRRILEDKLIILCMELEQECIGYNIKEWEPDTMYPVGKSDLIYHPNFTGDQMIFDEEYFITYGHHQLNNRLTKLNNKIL
jgi:hypothetical protein